MLSQVPYTVSGALAALAICLSACSSPSQPVPSSPAAPAPAPAAPAQPDVRSAVEAGSPEEFSRSCSAGLEEARRTLPRILDQRGESGPRTIDNTLLPYNELSRQVERSAALAGLMRSVHPDESIREAAKTCEKDVEKFLSALSLDAELYRAFVLLSKTPELTRAALSTRRLVEHTLRDFRRAGVDKPEATRQRIKEIDEKLVSLGQQFGENIVKDVREVKVSGPGELAGLPEDYITSHPPGKDGLIHITTDYPDYIPLMAYAESPELRKKLYIEQRSRGGMDNELVLRKILELRDEKARLLGYAHWADYITEDKMIGSAKNAEAFIERVVKVARPRAARDYKELLAAKRVDVPRAKKVQDWEKDYYENKVKAASYSFDPQTVRPYFEYSRVERGLLDITAAIYGLEYRRVEDAPVWHPSVKVFDVHLKGGGALGRIYLDMHPRDGKYKHAAQFTLQSGIEGVQLPEGVLVCNFPDPSKTEGPALMEHDDVVTMFHEFGHLMHHVIGGRQKWIDQSGVATEWDFVEAPSQMFEEWAWEHQTLKRFAVHHQTGEVIPADLVERMRKADKFALGIKTLQQMFYASISLQFHKIPPGKLEMMKTLVELQSKYTPFPYVEGTRFYASFGHLNGYSAIYYTYMWSLVIAKDLLTPFKEHGLMNTEWTHRYRDRILARGGTRDAAVLVEDFLGREYSFEAFEKFLSE